MEGYAAQIGYIVTAANNDRCKPVAIHQLVEPLNWRSRVGDYSLLFSPALPSPKSAVLL